MNQKIPKNQQEDLDRFERHLKEYRLKKLLSTKVSYEPFNFRNKKVTRRKL